MQLSKYIAFLRAINVGGRTVRMEDLRSLFEAMGFAQVETFIASGNVIFETRSGKPAALESKIETALHKALGHEVITFLRSPAELAAVAAARPFDAATLDAAQALNIAFLKEPLSGAQHSALQDLSTEIDTFHADGREIHWVCRLKQSESTFSNALLERKLKLAATFRSMTTVRKLADKYPPT